MPGCTSMSRTQRCLLVAAVLLGLGARAPGILWGSNFPFGWSGHHPDEYTHWVHTAIMINPADVADNIKKSGAYIPGIRPGKKTAEHIDRILTRITLIGALYMSAVCVLPTLLAVKMNVPFYFGGTALLICVGVGLDTIGQIEAHLVSRQYEGFVRGTRIRGRLGQ